MDPADVLWMAFAVIFFTGLFFLAYKIFSLSHALTVRVPRNMRIAPSLPRELHRWKEKPIRAGITTRQDPLREILTDGTKGNTIGFYSSRPNCNICPQVRTPPCRARRKLLSKRKVEHVPCRCWGPPGCRCRWQAAHPR